LSVGRGYPASVFSVLKYERESKGKKGKKGEEVEDLAGDDRKKKAEYHDWRGKSYRKVPQTTDPD
jgi:hypothetical protein